MLEGVRDDSLVLLRSQAHHRVSLAAACLAVGENSAVVAADDRLDQWKGSLVVNLPLG